MYVVQQCFLIFTIIKFYFTLDSSESMHLKLKSQPVHFGSKTKPDNNTMKITILALFKELTSLLFITVLNGWKAFTNPSLVCP